MQRLEVGGAVRPIYGSLGVKRLRYSCNKLQPLFVCCVKTAQFNKIVKRDLLRKKEKKKRLCS